MGIKRDYKDITNAVYYHEPGETNYGDIFEILLKTPNIDTNLLRCIDKIIAHPIIFHLTYADKIKVIAAYKRPSEGDANKWVVGDEYFETLWLLADTQRQKLPIALDLSGLYEQILRTIIPLPMQKNESLENHIERMVQVIAKDKAHQKLEARMNKEKQFNRKVGMNAELRDLDHEIEQLKGGSNG